MFKAPGSKRFQLQIVLDNQAQFVRGLRPDYAKTPEYRVSLGHPGDSFYFKRRSVNVQPGFLTHITYTPFEIRSEPSMMTLTVDERNCAFAEEISLNLFKNYSQEACFFECALQEARTACGCVPWEMPFDPEVKELPRICDLIGYACSVNIMETLDYDYECSTCVPNCNQVSYETFTNQRPLRAKGMCSDKKNLKGEFFNLKNSAMYPTFLETAEIVISRMISKELVYERCHRSYTEDVALIEVEFANGHYTRAKQAVAMTLEDKIAKTKF